MSMTTDRSPLLLREAIGLMLNELVSPMKKDDEHWGITAGTIPGWADYPGIDVKGYMKTLYRSKVPVKAVAIVRKAYEKDTVEDERAPEHAHPIDAIRAVKMDAAYTNEDGITFIPVDGAREGVAVRAARLAAKDWSSMKIDVVTTVESKSTFANEFGEALARSIRARFVPHGVLKGSPTMEIPPSATEKTRQTLLRSFEKNVAGGFSMKKVPAHARNLIKMNMGLDDEFLKTTTGLGSGRRPRVLLVDDIITTGATLDGAIEAMSDSIDVVGCAVIFKMQD